MVQEIGTSLSIIEATLPENRDNPYAIYHRLRAEHPVRWDEQWGGWVITGHAEVMTALHDPRVSAERGAMNPDWLPEEQREMVMPILQAILRQMLFLDPPDHTRLRSLATKAFTPRVVESIRTRIQALVDELLDAVAASGRMDVIRDLANPLPAIVIAEMLGVPVEHREQFKRWSDDFAAFLDGSTLTPETAVAALSSVAEFMDYFHELAQERRRSPRNDLLQALINAEEQGDKLTEEELLSNCVLLLAAGHETTTNLIGNGLLALLRHPDQLQKLRDDPSLIGSAVQELLRYESPVQATARVTKADMVIGGQQIPQGQYLSVILGAANRDPAQFPAPDRLDITRQDNRHVAFGYGIHYCLGAALARLEGQIAIGTVLRRMPNLRLQSEQAQWHPSFVFRSLETLPVTF